MVTLTKCVRCRSLLVRQKLPLFKVTCILHGGLASILRVPIEGYDKAINALLQQIWIYVSNKEELVNWCLWRQVPRVG